MALQVGGEVGLDEPSLKRLELGALFHDIGKIGIPSEILAKPGPLTPEERAEMELHPTLGERILTPISRLADIRPIVRHCHERYDGTGYPDGIAGERIPIESRIIFVCDTFHAMTTDRPYRRRLARSEACRLQAAAGTQFDPRIVQVFLRVVGEEVHGPPRLLTGAARATSPRPIASRAAVIRQYRPSSPGIHATTRRPCACRIRARR